MPENTHTLTNEELSEIRIALRSQEQRASAIGDVAWTEEIKTLRERFFGTESVVITYRDLRPYDPDERDLKELAL